MIANTTTQKNRLAKGAQIRANASRADIRVLADNIRSVHNIGSIFRTAETLGISHIYCAGTTPTPVDRFGQPRPDFSKVSLGAEHTLAWSHAVRASAIVRKLKKEGFLIIALEQGIGSVDYKKAAKEISSAMHTLVIVGNEVDGVAPSLVKSADILAEIPMRGAKESLNVSVATGIALFRWFDR